MVLNVIEVLSQSDLKAKRELVERVVASSALCRSARLRDLFLYLCARTLEEGVQDIHELEVGHKVFGRAAQYDTIADNIVRVHASMLRKRLNEYFEKEGRNESFVIEIPKGNYAPVFQERPPAREPAPKAPAQVEKLLTASDSQSDQLEVQGTPRIPFSSGSPAWALRAISLIAVFFCALSVYLFIRNRAQNPGQHSAITDQPAVRQFWSGIFPTSGPAAVVLDDASLEFYQDATNHQVALGEYYDRSYLSSVQKNAAAARLDPARINSLILSRQSSFAYSAVAWRMAQIAGELHSQATLQFARDLTFRQVKNGNVVLLGSAQSNPWIQPFESRISIAWVTDTALHGYYPQDKTAPAAALGQFRASESDANGRAGYASISFLPNLSGSGNALILTATGGSALGVALDFLSSESQMNQLRAKLGGGTSNFPYFDLLLKIEKGSKELNAVKLVICRQITAPREASNVRN
jgi:hypothetical protein